MPARPDRYHASAWRKSRASADQGECVEITVQGSFVLVRDSQNKNGVMLRIAFGPWRELMQRIRKEEPADGWRKTSCVNVNHKIKLPGYLGRVSRPRGQPHARRAATAHRAGRREGEAVRARRTAQTVPSSATPTSG